MTTSTTVRNATAILLLAMLCVALAFELGTRAFIFDMSEGLGRLRSEWTAATQPVSREVGDRKILLVGNSLLQSAIDVDALNSELPIGWRAERFAIASTNYFDWYYGMRRILSEGARVDVIVFCFEPRHIVQTSVRSEIFAHFLMQKRDLLDVQRSLDLNATGVADLLAANVSTFYALRMEIRKNLMHRLMPNFPTLTRFITRGGPPLPDSETLQIVGKQRLLEARNVAIANGSQLVLLMTPPVTPVHAQVLTDIGSEIDLPVFAPLNDNDLNASDYQPDGYHLDVEGRQKFTRAFIPVLTRTLQQLEPSK